MGLTPTGGVVMGTRPGDLDPGLVLYLLRQMEGATSGLGGEDGESCMRGWWRCREWPNDMKAVREAAAERRCAREAGG